MEELKKREKKPLDTDNSVQLAGIRVWGRWRRVWSDKVMEGDLTWGGEHTIQCTDDVLWNCSLETYKLLLTSVTSINSIKKKKEECLELQNASILLSHNPCCFSQPEVMGSSLLDTGTLGWGAWWGLDTSSLSETIAAEMSFPIVNHHVWVGESTYSTSSFHQSHGDFYKSLVTGLLFS